MNMRRGFRENDPHIELKKEGYKLLLKRGFRPSEIFFERTLIFENPLNKTRMFAKVCRPDLLGQSSTVPKSVVVECGFLSSSRRKLLEEHGYEVIHLPYPKTKWKHYRT